MKSIFTDAFLAEFKPLSVILIRYGKNGAKETKAHLQPITRKKKKNSTYPHKKGKKTYSKSKVSTITKTQEKTVETNFGRNSLERKELRKLSLRNIPKRRALHKKKHLQPRVSIHGRKHTRTRNPLQYLPARKPSRVPKMDDKKVRRRKSKVDGRTL